MPDGSIANKEVLAPKASTILRPGMPLGPGVQRYNIPGGGSAVVPISTGDDILITNLQGAQVAEVVSIDERGTIDTGVIGTKSNGQALGIQMILVKCLSLG